MCLQFEWFEERDKRRKARGQYGVSAREAESDLQVYHSTIYPVAVEMAEWILQNWSVKEIDRLAKPARDLLRQIAQENDLNLESPATGSQQENVR